MADVHEHVTTERVDEGRANSGPWIVLVVVLILLVAFGIWWFLLRGTGTAPSGGGNNTAPVIAPAFAGLGFQLPWLH